MGAIQQVLSSYGGAASVHLRYNAGDGTSGIWNSDAGLYNAGSAYPSGATDWTAAYKLLPGSPPAGDVMFWLRFGGNPETYTLPGLIPNVQCKVRIFFGDANVGFVMSVNAQGVEVIPSFTLQTYAGSAFRLTQKTFLCVANGSGEVVISFIGANPAVSAIDVIQPVPTQGYRALHASGDSITAGSAGIGVSQTWLGQMSTNLNTNYADLNQNGVFTLISGYTYDETRQWTTHNIAVGGETIAEQAGLWATYANVLTWPTDILEQNICLLFCGINNILLDGQDAATVEGQFTDFFAALDASFIPVVVKLLPCTLLTGPGQTTRTAVNAWLDLNSVGATAVIDLVALNPLLADASNTTYYSDGLHPTVAGAALIADAIQGVITTL